MAVMARRPCRISTVTVSSWPPSGTFSLITPATPKAATVKLAVTDPSCVKRTEAQRRRGKRR
jgi:hypothetical protein